jgi:hypothetical protein
MNSWYALPEQAEKTDTARCFGLGFFLPRPEVQAWKEFWEMSGWRYSVTKTLMLSIGTSLEWVLLPWRGEAPSTLPRS